MNILKLSKVLINKRRAEKRRRPSEEKPTAENTANNLHIIYREKAYGKESTIC